MLQHLDDPDPFDASPALRAGVQRRAAQLRRRRVSFASVVAIVVVFGFATASFAWVRMRDDNIQRVHLADGTLTDVAPSEPVDIVLVGSDSVSTEMGGPRADVVMLVRLDPAAGSLHILSFPRDLIDPRTGGRMADVLVGHDAAAVVDSVHLLVSVPIHHYIQLDFQGFVALVNEMGGVRLDVSAPIADRFTGLSLPAGCSQLDGTTALGLVRSRHLEVDGVADPTSDLGRTTREQAFITAALTQLSSSATDPLTLDRYARILGDHAVLDDKLDFTHLVALGRELRNVAPNAIESFTLPSTPATQNGAAVLISSAADADMARRFLIDGTLPGSSTPQDGAPRLRITSC